MPLLLGIGCKSWDANRQPYGYEFDAIPLNYRPISDMNEHTHTMYEYIMIHPLISNQRHSDKIWLCTIGTIHENIISCIFSRENIFELHPGSNPRPLDHEADTQPAELFGQVFNNCDPNSQ